MAEIPMTRGDIPKNVPIPEAVYRCRIHKITEDVVGAEKDAQGNVIKQGDPVWNVQLVVQDEGEFFGRYLFDTLFLPPARGAWKLRQLAESIDYPENENVNSDRMVDAEVLAVVEIESERTDPKTGKHYDARNRVKTYQSVFAQA